MIDPAILAPILAEIGRAPPRSVTALEGGTGAVYRVDLDDGAAIVLKDFAGKKAPPDLDAHAATLLTSLGVPVTQYLFIDDSGSRLPFPFALTNYVEGRAAVHYAGHPDYNDIFVEIGGLARKLHTLAMPGYGALCSPQHADNSAYVSALIAYALERFLYFGADPELAERLRETLGRGFAAIVPASGPAVFAHDDLHPGNILVVEEAGRLSLSGLIDFGNARAQSAVMDVAKTIFICEHMAPGSGPAILRGYGAIDHPAPTEALAYYTTLHRIIMWWWLRKVGVLATPDTPSELIDALWEAVAAP